MRIKQATDENMKECLRRHDGETKRAVIEAFLDGMKAKDISKVFKIPLTDVELIEMNYTINLIKSLGLTNKYATR